MDEIGPTGTFPLGKLVPDDEGAINIGIMTYKGRVIVRFGTKVSWLGLDKETALTLAQALTKHASTL